MQVEILGSGGAISIPRPGCRCRVCSSAREKGLPYSRGGPSTFVHGPDVLIDTPEEIKEELNRSQVTRINACFYSHWHPDHVMGRRVWESLNWEPLWPPQNRRTDVYLPQRVAHDFRKTLGSWDHLAYMERLGLVRVVELEEGESVEIEGISIRPIPLAQSYVYAFLFEGDGRRLLIAPDELKGWAPPQEVRGVSVAVIPMGLVELDPLSGERKLQEDHPLLQEEATFEETLRIADMLGADRVILSHIEEMDGLSFDDLEELARRLQSEGKNISFAHDTLMVDV